MARKIGQKIYSPGTKPLIIEVANDSGNDMGHIYYVGVQGAPSIRFGLNTTDSNTNIAIGYMGLYELDLSNTASSYIRRIVIPADTQSDVIVNYVYDGELKKESDIL